MAQKDEGAAHIENLNPEHEALLTGAVALASLFSSCVEAFGLIHPSKNWEKEEQLLLARLGLQQARLLIWGSVLGVASPPASVTDRAVPRHPSSAYPDLNEPTFFDARDPRLDDPNIRTTIEETLSAIVDRSSSTTREEMMAKYGLKPPKRYTAMFEPALDASRLESFRERHELLCEVAESYAHINTRRNNSLIHSSWIIADLTKFDRFIQLTQEKVDFLISLMDVKEQVDRGMRMDIRMFGWHVAPDRARTASDISKLRLLQEVCNIHYPEYVLATQQALDNIQRETREAAMPPVQFAYKQYKHAPITNGAAPHAQEHHKKRPGLLKLFRSFGKSKHSSQEATYNQDPGPTRSQSDAGVTRSDGDDDNAPLSRVRSKSVGGYFEQENDLSTRLERMQTQEDTVIPLKGAIDSPMHGAAMTAAPAPITRHDQYHGIARTDTRNLVQPGGDFSNA